MIGPSTFFSTSTSPVKRDATGPVAGGFRDFALVSMVVAIVSRYVGAKTGDPALGEIAGEAAAQGMDLGLGLLVGGVFGLFTAARKKIQQTVSGT